LRSKRISDWTGSAERKADQTILAIERARGGSAQQGRSGADDGVDAGHGLTDLPLWA